MFDPNQLLAIQTYAEEKVSIYLLFIQRGSSKYDELRDIIMFWDNIAIEASNQRFTSGRSEFMDVMNNN